MIKLDQTASTQLGLTLAIAGLKAYVLVVYAVLKAVEFKNQALLAA